MQTEVLPIIDINEITPSEYSTPVLMGDKEEMVNNTTLSLAENIIEAIVSGSVDPLQFAVKKKLITDALDMAMKNDSVKKILVEEVEKFGKSGATSLGATLRITSRPNYQYSADEKWVKLNDAIADEVAKIKEHEKKIQAACKNGGSIIDSDTGEVVASIVPHPTTTSISVSFKSKK